VHLVGSLESKRLAFLHQLIPPAVPIGVLLNPKYPEVDRQLTELQAAAGLSGRQVHFVRASAQGEIDVAFATRVQQRTGGILVASDPSFSSWREQLVAAAARYRLPAIYNQREFVEKGGLVSYGTDFVDGYRLAGTYVGKVLKGAKPADLPVVQPTKFELVINLRTAADIGFRVPTKLLAIADEVIE
jgi:putative ABC transport system substrate-binding protein